MGKRVLTIFLALLLTCSNFQVNVARAEDVPAEEPVVETQTVEEAETETVEETVPEEPAVETEEEPQSSDGDVVSYTVSGDLSAMSIQGDISLDQEKAKEAIEEETGLDEDEIGELTDDLFDEEGEGEEEGDPEDDTVPRSADGTNIEQITAKWITSDYPSEYDNEDPSLLYIKPAGNGTQSVRLQINYALSGEHPYEPGDVTITIPAHIFKKRNGADAGTISIPFPEDPSTKGDFNWKLVGDNIVLTNTKRMSAATKGYIQFAFGDLDPKELVDMDVSEPFSAYIEVVTHKGNTIALGSNELTAQFDTEAKVTSATKRQSGRATRVPASSVKIPQAWLDAHPEYADEEEFIVVNWYAYASISANTLYTLDVKDVIPDEYDGFLVNPTSEDCLEQEKKAVYTGYNNGTSGYYYFTSVYPASQFEPDTNYEFHNHVEFTVTEVDPEAEHPNEKVQDPDPQLVTMKPADTLVRWSYTDPVWYDPTGHFMVTKNGNDYKTAYLTHRKYYSTNGVSDLHIWYRRSPIHGWYGIYPSALNDIQDGEEIYLSYTIDTVGYIMPWTYKEVVPGTMKEDGSGWLIPPTRIKENYFNRPVTIVTEDTGMRISGQTDKLNVFEDYLFAGVEFPGDPWIYDGEPRNINDDGSWSARYALDGTFEYKRDYDTSHYPDIDLEVLIDGEWVRYATASWKSGSFRVTKADGTSQTSKEIKFTDEEMAKIENIRTVVTLTNAAIDYDIRPVMKILNTDSLKALVDKAFEGNVVPEMYFYNGVDMNVYRADVDETAADYHIVEIPDEGYDVVRGYTTDTRVYPYKSSRQTLSDIDYENRRVTIHYSARVEIQSVIPDLVTYQQAIADGRLQSETSGVWRDLLPKGVIPDLASIRLRSGDEIVQKYTIPNYNGSGRTLLVVEANLTPVPVRYASGDSYYYEDIPSISFDAYYSFDSLTDYGDNLHNVISFEGCNDTLGSIPNYIGEPDDPHSSNNVSTRSAFENDDEKRWMTDLNPDNDLPRFLYAGAYTKIDILSAARTSLWKDVMTNNDGLWSDGIYYTDPDGNRRDVYEGGVYAYRLRMMSNDSTISKDLIIYDSLEYFFANADENDEIDVDAPRWQGKFRGVDVSQLVDKGCAPIVYYGLENLTLSDETNPDIANTVNMDLTNSEIWVRADEYEGSLDDVKMIAVDARKKTDGSDFELQPLETAVVIVNMQAPSGEEGRAAVLADAHAYNNAYLLCTSVDVETGDADSDSFIRKDYTKVGLSEYSYAVAKSWDDDDDRDGIRPESIVFRLYVNGEPTETTLTLPIIDEETGEEVWHGEFAHLPYTDENGNMYRYSVKEETVEGYTETYEQVNEMSIRFTNYHEPERRSVEGDKIWVGDEDHPQARPAAIRVRLYEVYDGVETFLRQLILRPDARGQWHYTFEDLLKYRDHGEEIVYIVKEEKLYDESDSYTTEIDGLNIINTYHPYGDLYVSKTVTNTTEVSKDTEFEFTFTFIDRRNGAEEPIFDEFAYEVLDEENNVVSEGTVATSGTISIKGGQRIHIKEIPEGITYTVEETPRDGFTMTDSSNPVGEIKPNDSVSASFVNRYVASGMINLEAGKTLNNRELQRYQFRFELYQINEDGSETLIRNSSNNRPDETVEREDGTVESSHATITFGAIRYTEADAGKTFRYKVKEILQNREGYTYDSSEHIIEVTVTDNGDGTLSVVANEEQTAAAVFVNTYKAKGDLILRAWKNLKARTLKEGEFTYILYDDQGNILDTTTNNADGTIVFKALSFDETDIGKTYNFAVKEIPNGDETVIFDERVFGYTVEVLDNGDGTLSFNQGHATPVYTETVCPVCDGHPEAAAGEKVEYNAADPRIQALLGMDRPLSNLANDILNRIAQLLGVEPLYTDTGYEYTGTDAELASIYRSFENYIAENSDYPVESKLNGDTARYYITNMLIGYYPMSCEACGGSGKIMEITGWDTEEGQMPVFENELKDGSLAITKLIDNPEDADPDQEFHFKVKLIGDDIEDGTIEYELVKTGEDDEPTVKSTEMTDGEFDLYLKGDEKAIFKDLPAGTAYQVWEETPNNWVLVEQSNTSGNIEPLVTAEAVFKNSYQPGVTSVQFTGTKLLDYRAAKEGAFTFVLVENGEVIQTKQTLDGGFIQFDPIVYDKVEDKENGDVHVYEIYELDPEDDTIDYDMHHETVTATVTDDGEGNLSSVVEYANGIPHFENMTRPGNLRISKAAETTDANKDDLFTFKITLNNQNGMPISDDIYWYVESTPADAGKTSSGKTAARPSGSADASAVSPEPLLADIDFFGVSRKKLSASIPAPSKIEPAAGSTITRTMQVDEVTFDQYSDGTLVIRPTNGDTGTVRGPAFRECFYLYFATTARYITVNATVKVTGNCDGLFSHNNYNYGPQIMEEADLRGMDTSEMTSARFMFSGSHYLRKVDVSTWDTSKITDFSRMFNYCTSLKALDLSSFTTESAIWSSDYGLCDLTLNSYSLEYINFGNMAVPANAYLYQMLLDNWSGISNPLSVIVVSDQFRFSSSSTSDCFAGSLNGVRWYRLGIDDPADAIQTSELLTKTGAAVAGTWVRVGYNPNFTLHYDANGGVGTMEDFSGVFTDLQLPECEFSNYPLNFIGWDEDKDAIVPRYQPGDGYVGMAGEEKTLYAIWASEDAFILRLDGNGGYVRPQQVRVNGPDDKVDLPEATHPKGYEFIGWNSKPDGSGTVYGTSVYGSDFDVEPGSYVTIYAQYIDPDKNLLRVEHYQEKVEPIGEYGDPAEVLRSNHAYGAEVTPPVRNYPGFIAPETQTVVMDGAKTVKYYYERMRYTIKFDGNGADSGQMSQVLQMAGGLAQKLPDNVFQRKGYIFLGWNTEPDGSGTSLVNKQTVNNLATENHQEITLYAQWLDNSEHELEPTNGVIIVQCRAGETIVIPDLPAGTTYTIEEIDVPAGWTFTGSVDETGQIYANTDSEALFRNKYSASTEINLVAHKMMSNEKLLEGQFSFELLDAEKKVIQTVSNDAVDDSEYIDDDEGNLVDNEWIGTAPVVFNSLNFDQDDIGTHTYYIREVNSGENGIVYDEHEIEVTVTVRDGGQGVLIASASYGEQPLFTNSMDDTSLKVTKTVENAPEGDEEEFTFKIVLKDADGQPLEGPFKGIIYGEGRGKAERDVTVTKYSHTQNVNDTGFKLRDYGHNWSNYYVVGTDRTTGDSLAHVVTIEGAEELTVDIYYNGESTSYDWACVWQGAHPNYTAYSNYGSSLSGRLGGSQSGSYTVNGNILRSMGHRTYTVNSDSATFSFRSDYSGVGAGYGYYAIITGVVKEEYVPNYEEVEFSSGDTVSFKPSEYFVIEGLPHGATYEVIEIEKPNWTLIDSSNTTGRLVGGVEAEASFTNTYEEEEYDALGSVVLTATKKMENGLIDRPFTFELSDEDGIIEKKVLEPTDTKEAQIEFKELFYVLADLEGEEQKTFYYYVTETHNSSDEVEYDRSTYIYKVTVSDNGDHTLKCEVEVEKDQSSEEVDEVVFVNKKKNTDLKIRKILDKYELENEKKFVYKVDIYFGEELFDQRLVTIEYSKEEGGTKEIIVPDIPIGATVKVTEIYSGATYKLTSDEEVTLEIVVPPVNEDELNEVNTAEFVNTYDDTKSEGGGIVNSYSKDEDGEWSWKQKKVEEGGTDDEEQR